MQESQVIKTILVPVTGTERDPAVLATAAGMMRYLGARLDFLHVRPDAASIAAALGPDGGAFAAGSLIETFERDAALREKTARGTVEAFCGREGLALGDGAGGAAGWHRQVGNEAGWVAEHGRAVDLVVAARPDRAGAGRELLEAALFDTGRPLLIPGPTPVVPETVAVAWKSTREAARAVTAATPFLVRAVRVAILVAAEGRRGDPDAPGRLCATLRRHNPAVEVRLLQPGSGGAAEALLAAAAEIGAGLLVMGGYGHSRLRELVFGGVTEHVIRAAAIPVLMAH